MMTPDNLVGFDNSILGYPLFGIYYTHWLFFIFQIYFYLDPTRFNPLFA